jgi:hypothetical protein
MNLRGFSAAAALALVAGLAACGTSGEVTTTGNPPPVTTTTTTTEPPTAETTTVINGESYTCSELFGYDTACGDNVQALFDTYKDTINTYIYDDGLEPVFTDNPSANVGDIVYGGLVACAVLSQDGRGNFRDQYLAVLAGNDRTQQVVTEASSYVRMWVNAASSLCPAYRDEVFGVDNPGSIKVD